MFLINIYLRLGIVLVTLAGGIFMWSFWGFWYGFPFVLVGVILLVGYFLMGTIQSAATMMQTGDFQGAQKRLDLTIFPALLLKPNKAYLEMLKGTIAGQAQDFNKAEIHFEKANKLGMQSDNEKAMIYLQLSSIAAQKGNWQKATLLFNNLKKFKVTEPQIKNQIKEFEKAIKQRGMVQAAQRQGMSAQTMNRSGKRTRPKMR